MPAEIRAEIAGTVLEVCVRSGDRVSEGDTVLVIESMKMEIPVASPMNGALADLCVAEGDVVALGQLLARIEG